jgi:hypothetical protein|uniref:Uncharacterized protein n=1 Tax=viral metagenome TaxID=1070528 RepID=A0A6C0AKU9_9ZZZZ
MNLKKLIHTKFGKYAISILLGLGLATIFRKVCKDRNCILFKAPEIEKIENSVYKYNNKCYKFKPKAETCDYKKKIIQFA